MAKPFLRFFYLILMLLSGLFTSQHVLALSCVNSADNSTSFNEAITTNIPVPQNVADGTIIWRSELRTMLLKCYLTYPGGAEYVTAYFNPGRVTLPTGLSLGVVFNGVDINSSNSSATKGISIGTQIPACSGSCQDYPLRFNVNYYVYVKKIGSGAAGPYPITNFSVFQLDGAGGMNDVPNSNFVYKLTNVNNIVFVGCYATAAVSPNPVKFDNIMGRSPVVGRLAKESPFTITVSKTCNDPLNVSATYTSTLPLINADELNVNNGLSLKIKNVTSGNYISYNVPQALVNISTSNTAAVPFLAQLVWNKNTSVIGTFTPAVTFTLIYN